MDRHGGSRPLLVFMRDRLLNILCFIMLIGLCCCLYMLENVRYPGLIETATMLYFVLLAVVVYAAWLSIDYMRQRYYFKQVNEALERSDELGAATIIQSLATEEQKLVTRLIREQHRAYLNELNKYRRQQEMHNHFVMQWVHHMKTPVSVVDLLIQEARRQPPAGEEGWLELIGSIQEETERQTRALEIMLHTARLDKFELDLHIRRTALHELIRSSVNAHKRLCIRYSIFPKIEGEAWVETDDKWMMFVMNQLISNAIKYSKQKPGVKTLLFRLYAADGNGSGIRLQVIDSGIGIAPHDLPRIFEPFFTGENGRATGESTGMGLYLAKQVCSRLGIGIGAESELGAGTTFTLTFQTRGIHVLDE
ncbi:sensor histidine kinase [Paenibacillus soyae]|uniref:histidine kinase n=1 Tax=Paenibacillus soyae TaxID=2969249 RepID=A0A9X2MQ43_9BACL|nr:sensor histidine kinase [Paenibacillus soyae]MCR2806203.1 sensor histidine kinase [Paenibacillus soyae]